MNEERELRMAMALVRRADALWIFGVVTGLMILGVAGMLLAAAVQVDRPGAFLTALLGELITDPVLVGIGVIGLLVAPIGFYGIRGSRVRLTPEGLYGHVSPWPGFGFAGWSTGDIRIPWSRVRSADLVPGRPGGVGAQKLARYRLILRTADGTFRLAPYFWLAAGEVDHRIRLRQVFPGQAFDADEVIEQTPLVRAVRARDLFERSGADEVVDGGSRPAFDLKKHRGLSGQVAILLVALAFAVIDGLATNPYRLVGDFPWLFVVPLGVFAALLVVLTGRGAPRLERTVVGVLTVAAIVAASYPLFLRINGWTGSDGEITYVATEAGRFKPVNRDYPVITVDRSRAPEYWAQYTRHNTYKFLLVRGVGNVYQLDTRPIHRATRAFYERRENE